MSVPGIITVLVVGFIVVVYCSLAALTIWMLKTASNESTDTPPDRLNSTES